MVTYVLIRIVPNLSSVTSGIRPFF